MNARNRPSCHLRRGKEFFKVQELCLRIKREKEFKNRDRRNLKIEI
jgi:hypothetical protein